jgi:hypothetical protein
VVASSRTQKFATLLPHLSSQAIIGVTIHFNKAMCGYKRWQYFSKKAKIVANYVLLLVEKYEDEGSC